MNVSLPNVDASVEAVLEHLQSEALARVQLEGRASAGKSVALKELAARLDESEDRFGVLVSPPAGALDAGPVALVQIGSTLVEKGMARDQDALGKLKDPERPWEDKRGLVHGWLANAKDQAVILCDEPLLWPANSHWHFARPAKDVIEHVVFNGTGCDVVIAGRVPRGTATTAKIELQARCDPEKMLEKRHWGPLRKGAERVLGVGAARLKEHSPLQLRLLVALSTVDPEKDPTGWIDLALEELAALLLERMMLKEEWAELVDCWRRVARVRRPFDQELLDTLGGAELEQRGRAVLERCLLYEQQDRRMLHETLRREVQQGRPPEGEETLQGRLAEYYRGKFGANRDAEALSWEMEAYHHASKSGSLDFEEYREFFVEQLNALGYHLSKEEERYEAAVAAYRRALSWESENDYAHHYLAYNLDVEAESRSEVEEHYKIAVGLSPSHPWWHTRLINFYAATGRFDRAREAWNSARAEFETADGDLTVHQCEDLHMWVARTVLEFGQIDFCEMVLRGIPEELKQDVSGYRTVSKKMEAARLARDYGNFVPGPYLRPEWWNEGPFLFPSEGVRQWVAGEVRQSSEDGITIEAGVIDLGEVAEEEPPVAEEIEISAKELLSWGNLSPAQINVGDFVELVISEAEGETTSEIRIYPVREWVDNSLPPLRPDPRRYL